MTMLFYFLKKLCTDKLTIFLRAIILTVGMFLVALILTLGFNASDNISHLFDNHFNYTIICAEAATPSSYEIHKNGQEELLAFARSDHELLQEICGRYVEIPVTEYRVDSDPVYFEKNIIAGSSVRTDTSVWIGKNVLDNLGLTPADVIGKKAMLMNAGMCTVAGVYDNNDDIVSTSCIVYTNQEFLPQTYYIDVYSVDNVDTTIDKLTECGYTVLSHAEEINSVQSYIHMTEYAVFFISILIVFASSIILYSSLKASIEETYTYLALLKAIGYTDKNCSLYVFAESLIIFLCSTVLSAALYMFGVPAIMNLLVAEGVQDLFGFAINDIFAVRFDAIGLSTVITAVFVAITSLICVRFVSKRQVYEIFFEGNQ